MKSRILKSLKEYSSLVETDKTPQMAFDLCEALELSTAELAFRSRQALKLILQDYAAFEVVTLDRFTHRIIRSFARDLGLSLSFEVEIQQEQMLSQVVERIIDKAGSDKEITPLLEQFTLQKMDDQLSWDISANLFEIAKLLLKENDRIPLQYVLSQSRTAFGRQYNFLKTYSNTCKQNISLLGTEVLGLIESKQLTQADFSRGTLYKHFQKLKQLDFVRLYENKLEENLESLKSLRLNLEENGYDIEKVPLVFQWNKRDMSNAAKIEDLSDNTTRFLVVGREPVGPSGADKTSIMVSMQNRPGALFSLLEPFHRHGISLTSIETRPSKQGMWSYVFFIDFDGHSTDPSIRAMLDEVAKDALEVKLLGSYPRALRL